MRAFHCAGLSVLAGFLVHGSLTANWCCECHSVIGNEFQPPHRTLAWLFQCVTTAQRRGASVDYRDRVVTWRCWSSSMYCETEVDRALNVMVMTAVYAWHAQLDR